jgi:hypothetical protein
METLLRQLSLRRMTGQVLYLFYFFDKEILRQYPPESIFFLKCAYYFWTLALPAAIVALQTAVTAVLTLRHRCTPTPRPSVQSG